MAVHKLRLVGIVVSVWSSHTGSPLLHMHRVLGGTPVVAHIPSSSQSDGTPHGTQQHSIPGRTNTYTLHLSQPAAQPSDLMKELADAWLGDKPGVSADATQQPTGMPHSYTWPSVAATPQVLGGRGSRQRKAAPADSAGQQQSPVQPQMGQAHERNVSLPTGSIDQLPGSPPTQRLYGAAMTPNRTVRGGLRALASVPMEFSQPSQLLGFSQPSPQLDVSQPSQQPGFSQPSQQPSSGVVVGRHKKRRRVVQSQAEGF